MTKILIIVTKEELVITRITVTKLTYRRDSMEREKKRKTANK